MKIGSPHYCPMKKIRSNCLQNFENCYVYLLKLGSIKIQTKPGLKTTGSHVKTLSRFNKLKMCNTPPVNIALGSIFSKVLKFFPKVQNTKLKCNKIRLLLFFNSQISFSIHQLQQHLVRGSSHSINCNHPCLAYTLLDIT